MILTRRQRRTLRVIERHLADSDPGLSALCLSFAARAGPGAMPLAEQEVPWAFRMAARLRRKRATGERKRDWWAENGPGGRFLMLHVRVVSPTALTVPLTERLAAAPGVQNVVVRVGAARRPDGDAVQFDVRDGAANPVFTALRELGLDRDGAICVERVDATLIGQTILSRNHGALRQETAPVWEMVEAVIREGEAYAPSFYILLTVAALIGAVGILTNSQILIVGAMVVGPEYNAIIGVALGIASRVRAEVRDGLLALSWGFLGAIALTLLFGLAVRASGKTPAPFLNGVRPVADLINTPNIFSVIVAVLAGIVGVVSLTQARANALIGVFISVTTIPAAASVGLSIAYASWSEAGGSVLQLLLNVVLLIVVGAAGLRAQRAIWQRRSPDPPGR